MMHTLFPVQTSAQNSHLDVNPEPDIEAIQWSLMSHLVECFLLEQWVDEQLIQVTTTTYYLSIHEASKTQDTRQFLESLPQQYQDFFDQDNSLMVMKVDQNRQLLLLVEPAYTSPWRLSKSCLPVIHSVNDSRNNNFNNDLNSILNNKHHKDSALLEPVSSAQQLLDIFLSMMDSATLSDVGVLKLKESLEASFIAQQQSTTANITTAVCQHPHWHQTLIAAEQWASLMDRPFHPLAKGKLGFTATEYQRYMADFNQPIKLVWVAIAKSHVMVAEHVQDMTIQNPATYLLDTMQQQSLMRELDEKGIVDTHIAMPVHPWQITHVIDEMYADDLANGTVVTLKFDTLITYASSSMRSMLIDADTPNSIKLPIGVYALNSKRYLPALKLINGEKNQAILMQARTLDPALSAQLRLWDERLWWGYMSPSHVHDKSSINPYFYQGKPTHLGAMLRQLPADLCDDTIQLLPMASLGMLVYQQGVSHHIFDDIVQEGIQNSSQSSVQEGSPQNKKIAVIKCFSNLCEVFLGTMLRCLRLGFAPEMHGQNIVIVLKDNRFTSLLLRDHDSVRIYLPWLARHQIADPDYLSPPDFKNRLYRETPQALVFYLQSLGLLVNIRAIIESLVEHYEINEDALWREAMTSIEEALMTIDFDDDQRQIIRDELLSNSHYPHKTLLLPVIARGSDPHGSMPAGESRTINPFMRVNRNI
ncbi:IucA/IucC family protein [Psychrobacter okhotskensis]|jgi:siderophore synthetase component|uniref:IucA/IucC family protein n=2 Tax=Moraxellaceae TaxID=468 RepID=UPI00191A8AB5|nr:IucA/IucC family protein [Psychrobacter immobilis]